MRIKRNDILLGLTASYRWAVVAGAAATPTLVAAYLIQFQSPDLLFRDLAFHEVAVSGSIVLSIFAAWVAYKCYLKSGDASQRYLSIAFLGFGIVYLPHGAFTRMADHNMAFFLLFGPMSRIVMAGFLTLALFHYGRESEPAADRTKWAKWLPSIGLCLMANLLVGLLAHSPFRGELWLRASMEGAAVLFCLAGIALIYVRRISSSLMRVLAFVLLIFAQSSIVFLLAKPWNHVWWMGHCIFAAGFLFLSYRLMKAYRQTGSVSEIFSDDELAARLDMVERNFRGLAEIAPIGIIAANEAGVCTYANKGWSAIAGMDRREAIGNGWIGSIHPDDRGILLEGWASLREYSESWRSEIRICSRGEKPRWAEFAARAIRDDAGETIGFVAAVADVTERKESEERIRKLEQFEAISTITGGLAHEFNNGLCSAVLNAGLLKESIAQGTPEAKRIDATISSLNRCLALMAQLLALGRHESANKQPLAVEQIVSDVTTALLPSIPEYISLERKNPPMPGVILGSSQQLIRIFINLIDNAREAIGNVPGKIQIQVDHHSEQGSKHDIKGNKIPGGEYVRVSVADTGRGIPPDIRNRVFLPFFTTKDVGRGMGLGLSVVEGVVSSHDAYLCVEGGGAQGTKFDIYFPVLSTPVEANA